MRKTIILLGAMLALIACNKETPVKESSSEISKIVFNMDVNRADDTKGVKAGWENGDKVYVFFQGLVGENKYAIFTYDGTSWAKSANGITAAEMTTAAASYDHNLTAICVPYGEQPVFTPSGSSFTITGGVRSFYLSVATTYTTAVVDGSSIEVAATLNMAAPNNLVQFCVQGVGVPGDGNEFVLTVNNVKPFTVGEIVPGSSVGCSMGTVNFPMPAVSTAVNKDAGYYAWGILDNASAGAIDYNFQLVTQNADKKYAISSESRTASGKDLTGSAAIKLTGFTNHGNFVSLGYAGARPLWATGNLSKTASKIVDPLEAGEYFRYGKTTPYSASESNYTGTENPLSTSADVAYSVNTSWRIPTKAQFDALINASNTTAVWKDGWATIAGNNGGLLITSKVNGISLFFAAAGRYYGGSINYAGGGYFWSSTPSNSNAYDMIFTSENIDTDGRKRDFGFSVRPIKN